MNKFAPLIILGIFLAGIAWMVFSMKNVMNITDHRKVHKTEASSK